MARNIGLPEAVQVEETLGQAFGGCHVGTVAAVGEGVAAAQTQPLAEVLVQLRICRQTGLLPAERRVGGGVRGRREGRNKEVMWKGRERWKLQRSVNNLKGKRKMMVI